MKSKKELKREIKEMDSEIDKTEEKLGIAEKGISDARWRWEKALNRLQDASLKGDREAIKVHSKAKDRCESEIKELKVKEEKLRLKLSDLRKKYKKISRELAQPEDWVERFKNKSEREQQRILRELKKVIE